MTFGHRMKMARSKKGLTQRELAEVLGFETAQFISNMERGKAPIPAHLIPRLSALLAIPETAFVDYLLRTYKARILSTIKAARSR